MYDGSVLLERCTKSPIRPKSLTVFETVFHSRSEFVYLTLSMRGKIWSRIRATVNPDFSGMGVLPTWKFVRAQSSPLETGSLERDRAVALATASTKVFARKWIQSSKRWGQWQARLMSPLTVIPVGVLHGALPSRRISNFGIARARPTMISSSTLEEQPAFTGELYIEFF